MENLLIHDQGNTLETIKNIWDDVSLIENDSKIKIIYFLTFILCTKKIMLKEFAKKQAPKEMKDAQVSSQPVLP